MTQPDQYFPSTSVNDQPGFGAYSQQTQSDYQNQMLGPWTKTLAPLIRICDLVINLPFFQGLRNLGSGSGYGPLGDILTALNQLANGLSAAITKLINSLAAVDWLTPSGIVAAFQALTQFVKDFIAWVKEIIQVLLGLIPPQFIAELKAVFEIDLLHADWNQFVDALTAIDWSIWNIAPDLMGAWSALLTFLQELVQWARLVLQNITGFDLFQMFAVFDFPALRAAFSNFQTALGAINWFGPTALNDFVSAAVSFAQALGNWLLTVINNLMGGVTNLVATIHGMFSSLQNFLMGMITNLFGSSVATEVQTAFDTITGVTGSTFSDAIARIYHQFQDVLAMFGNPANIGTDLFNITTAIENFITEMLNPTGLIGGAAALAQNVIDSFVNTFLGLAGTGFTISDLIRAIQSIPTRLLTGSLLPGQISQLNIGALSSSITQFLVNPTFDTINSLIGQGIWTWDGTTGPPGLSTSIFTDAIGVLRELFSNGIATAAGQILNISGQAQWFGFNGPANSIALTVAQFNANNTLIGYDTIAAVASPGATSSGWVTLANPTYQVPTTPAGITSIMLRPIVTAAATAGRVHFGNMSVTPTATVLQNPLIPSLDASKILTGQFSQAMITNLTSDLSTLTTNVGAAALATDLHNTWNTIISALGGTGSGLSGIQAALLAIPGGNISGTINSIAVNIQNMIDAILAAGNPSYVNGSGTLASVTGWLASLPQANIAGLTGALNAKALQTDLTALLSNLGLGTGTLAAITNRFANLSAGGTMPQSAITNLVTSLNTLTAGINAAALNTDLQALMSNLGAGVANLTAITSRFGNLNSSGAYTAANINISQIINLSGFLSNLNSSGVLTNIGAVQGLPGYLTNMSTSGVLQNIASVLGLPGYLTNMSSGGLLNIAGVPTGQLTRSNIADLGTVYTAAQQAGGNTTTGAVGSGGIMRRTNTTAVSIPCSHLPNTTIGPQLLPSGFFDGDEVAPSADLTRTLSSATYQVSLAGWYRCDICLMVVPQANAIWNICPVLFRNGSAAKYGDDSVSYYTSTFGGVSPRFIQSSFELYLQVNDYVQAGYDAFQAATASTIASVLTGQSGQTCYFSISLNNRSLA